MENMEEVLMELNKFEGRPASAAQNASDPLPAVLEEYLDHVARTGSTLFAWPKIKPLLRAKMERVIEEFYTH